MSRSCRFGVAVHIGVLLALQGTGSVTSDWIAGSVNTNPVVVRRLISALAKAGLVKSQRGIKGGTMLARQPHHITLLDIARAVESDGDITTHNQPPNPACPVGANIVGVLMPVLERAEAAKEKELDKVTLADLARRVSRADPHVA